jgi:virginiamycin A acetyltransferase
MPVDHQRDSAPSTGLVAEKYLGDYVGRYARWSGRIAAQSNSPWAAFAVRAYRLGMFRGRILALIRRLEGGEMASVNLRRLLREYHGVEVGPHSYGACLVPGQLPPGSMVGNYCSTADGLRVFRRNHPVKHLSQHPYFYNRELGLLREDAIEPIRDNPLRIGHDVWIGAGVTILPGCRRIGNGAIIGAGSVATRDVAAYSIVAGNPARPLGNRFDQAICDLIERSRWWLLPLDELAKAGNLLFEPVTQEGLEAFVDSLGIER